MNLKHGERLRVAMLLVLLKRHEHYEHYDYSTNRRSCPCVLVTSTQPSYPVVEL